jgi:ATP-dependent Clp endopeptidase proteolytic subunit ClpP
LTTAETVDVEVYGTIQSTAGWWSDDSTVSVTNVLKTLEGLSPSQTITLHINSVGGEVSEGVTLYNRLRAIPNTKNVIVEGLAASIASVVAMAGDNIHMALGSQMMVHDPWAYTAGNSTELRHAADVLDTTKESLLDIYEKRTGMQRDDIASMMTDETWLSANDAKDKGFCDTVDSDIEMVAQVSTDDLIVNGMRMKLTALKGLPIDKYEKVQKGDKKMTLEELMQNHADVYNAAVQVGVEQERARMKSLDELATPERLEAINRAKYETMQNASEIAIELLKATPAPAPTAFDARKKDAEVLNSLNTPPTPGVKDQSEEDKILALIDKVMGGAK